MPLLKKQTFEKIGEPEFLRDDEEVFYCEATNEIFRDYDEFCERITLCNAMVWTCSLTGRANLTYPEALESEENARKSLREFPSELKMPILYLASKTRRTAFSDLAEDVYHFAKDRYFIGEIVETSFTGAKWKDSHVLQVIAPTDDQLKAALKASGEQNTNPSIIPANLFKYEIEHMDAFDDDISQMIIAEFHQIRRKKGIFSRDRCKLFIKQFVEQDANGLLVIKPEVLKNYQINTMTFDQMFDGPQPQFGQSKRLEKSAQNNNKPPKKSRQESLDKFLTRTKDATTNGTNANTLERIRMKEEEFTRLKAARIEEQLALKQKKKEQAVIVSEELRNWYKPKEDLELPDQRKLPKMAEVVPKIPEEYYGDMLMILEFTASFAKILSTKDFFSNGLTMETIERALLQTEVAGPLIDILQMLLSALFNMQETETSQHKTQVQNPTMKHDETARFVETDAINVKDACRLASVASVWSLEHQGLPIGRLPLYSLTTSEILRLHLLSSGAIINTTGAKWRYQQRGGYLSEDDPGLYFRLHEPQILKALCTKSVVELAIGDKLKIITCLTDQLLTYADVRDEVEDRMHQRRMAKYDHRGLITGDKKILAKYGALKTKLAEDVPDKESRQHAIELNKIETEERKEMAEHENKMDQTLMASFENQIFLGEDRAFRRYFKLAAIPAVFINDEDQFPGECLPEIVAQNPDLIKGDREATRNHIRKMLNKKLDESTTSPHKSEEVQTNGGVTLSTTDDLLMCSARPSSCLVHSKTVKKQKWTFISEKEQLDDLMANLNCRGRREHYLLGNLRHQKVLLDEIIAGTPSDYLSGKQGTNDEEKRSKNAKTKYEDANLGYPNTMRTDEILQNVLIENILEMEEKIHAGNLGTISVKSRDKWRHNLQNKNYGEMEKTLKEHENGVKKEESRSGTPVSDTSEELLNSSHFITVEPDVDNTAVLNDQPEKMVEAIQALSIALVQVGQSVGKKYLKKPLGRIGANRLDKKLNGLLSSWEQSLLAATSFSQIFLHYSTLDSCVMWSKSVLVARCRICRRQNDSENMLLCDSCNLGHHLYCLKPKLKCVPSGDWFCSKCKTEKQKNEPPPPPTPVKKRPIFRDEEIDDEESANSTNSENQENSDESDDEEEDSDDEEMQEENVEMCKRCGSSGELICCEKCVLSYHLECAEPPLRRAPRGPWSCGACKQTSEKRKIIDKDYMVNGKVVQRSAVVNGQRRCASKALDKIHNFAKSLRHQSESGDDDSSEDEVISRRSSRREEGRVDLPLHNAALHEVLAEIMKDSNAWPFVRPVQKNEVPDYYDVITKPMDFGTIKYKLNMGEYTEDAHFMSDALLVFQNCNTYNHTEDDVYKCGVLLLKHFQKKCRELGLKLPDLMDYNDDSRPKKRLRSK